MRALGVLHFYVVGEERSPVPHRDGGDHASRRSVRAPASTFVTTGSVNGKGAVASDEGG